MILNNSLAIKITTKIQQKICRTTYFW